MSLTVNLFELATLSPAERNRLLSRTEADLTPYESRVRAIIDAVIKDGDEALARFAREFDRAPVDAASLAASPADFAAAERTLHPDVRAAMDYAGRIDPPLPCGPAAGGDVVQRGSPRRFRRRAEPADPVRRLLRPARQGRLSLGRADDDHPRQGRRRSGDHRPDPARPRWPDRRCDAGRRPACRRSTASTRLAAPRASRLPPTARRRSRAAPRSSAPAAPGWRWPSAWYPTSSTPAPRQARAS